MRRAAVSLVTAATVLWHAVVGCCAHHDGCVEHAHDHVVACDHVEADHQDEPDADHEADQNDHAIAERHCSCTHDEHDAAPIHTVAQEESTSHSEPAAPHSQPAAPCEDAECSFLAVKLTSSSEWLGEQLLAADVPEIRSYAVTDVTVVADRLAPGDDRPPPLRTHLALSILLV